jgi:hypothetical protein
MYPLAVFGLIDARQIIMGGVVNTVLVFLFFDVCTDPDGQFTVLGFTCFLPKRYLPIFVIIGMLALFNSNLAMLGLVLVFELYQYGCRKRPFFAFSVGFYRRINFWMPEWLKKTRSFVDCESLLENLEGVCEKWGEEKE